MKDRIKQLLGCGLTPVVVASATGASEGYISQLMGDETFAAEVQQLRLANFAEAADRDKNWDKLEDKLLEKLETLLPLLVRPMEVVRALQTVNSAKRRSAVGEPNDSGRSTIVHLHMPAILAAKFVVNPLNQVIEIEGRTIATMPAKTVVKQLNDLRNAESNNLQAHQQDKERAENKLLDLHRITHEPIHELI